MATIKVFDSEGVKELRCFDTLSEVAYLLDDDLREPICEPEEESEE